METWTLDTCGLLSLFTSCVVLWTAFVNLKTRQNVKHLHNTRKSKKMAAANQRLVKSLPLSAHTPLSPPWRDNELTFHFSLWVLFLRSDKPENPVVVALFSSDFGHFQIPPAQCEAFPLQSQPGPALLHCLSLRRSQRVYILTCSTVCLLISARLGAAGHKLQPIKAQSCTLLVKSREQSNNNTNNIANLPLIVS